MIKWWQSICPSARSKPIGDLDEEDSDDDDLDEDVEIGNGVIDLTWSSSMSAWKTRSRSMKITLLEKQTYNTR